MSEHENLVQLSEGRNKFERFFFFMGPLLASFHVASYIVGFFSVGAVAKWITEQWFPFTRWFWSQVLIWVSQYISMPELSNVEKDALTTVIFFAPLGIYALFFRKKHPLDNKYKYTAWIIGVFFLSVVGIRLISVVFDSMFDFKNGFIPTTILGWLSIVINIGLFLFMIISTLKQPITLEVKQKRIIGAIVLFPMIYFLVLIIENIMNLGIVTVICFFLVFILALASMILTPYRLSWGLGSLIAFIASGLIFEAVMLMADFIQNVNQS